MDTNKKIQQLQAEIKRQLEPLIGEKCILTDLPYHDNLGDVLIWQGELDFLKSINKTPINQSNYLTFNYPTVDERTTILLHGGGNFGDLYRILQEFRLNVISKYLNQRIIVFPQSVWYNDESLIAKDAAILAKHKNLYLCARDKWSYDFMKEHFSANNILLVPDMAFCINKKFLVNTHLKNKKSLYFKRTDKELDNTTVCDFLDVETHDWPTYESRHWSSVINYWLLELNRRIPFGKSISNILIDFFVQHYMRSDYVKIASKFLSSYGMVITTRLHALILSTLMGIPVRYIDNTTGKLSAFANTWLSDYTNVKPFSVSDSL